MAGITSFRFPKDQERRAKWIVAIKWQDWARSGSEVHILLFVCVRYDGHLSIFINV